MPDLPASPHLFLEFHGLSDASVEEQAEWAREACAEEGGRGFDLVTGGEEERRKLWAARHSTYYAALALRPGSRGVSLVAVRRERAHCVGRVLLALTFLLALGGGDALF